MRQRNGRTANDDSEVHWGINPGNLVLQAFGARKADSVMSGGDINVAIAAGAVMTQEWWMNAITFIPQGLQYITLVSTVVYVIFRAANEIRKFYGKGAE